jgi:hypothetical protein
MELPGNPGISSELIFPLNTLLAGVTFRGERTGGRIDGGRDWNFEVSLAVNLLAPFGVMKDYDWDMYPGYPKTVFSYTESDARLVWFLASAAWKPVLSSGGWGNLKAVLGYRLQYVYQEANGYVGWQYLDFSRIMAPQGPIRRMGMASPSCAWSASLTRLCYLLGPLERTHRRIFGHADPGAGAEHRHGGGSGRAHRG